MESVAKEEEHTHTHQRFGTKRVAAAEGCGACFLAGCEQPLATMRHNPPFTFSVKLEWLPVYIVKRKKKPKKIVVIEPH